MGFFKSMGELNKIGKEAQANFDPGKQMQDGMAQMQAAQQMMAEQTEAANLAMTGQDAKATVVSAAQTGAMVNFQPTMQVQLTVFPTAGAPYPATVTTVVPQHHLTKTQPGTALAVKVDASAPDKVWVNWDAPAPA